MRTQSLNRCRRVGPTTKLIYRGSRALWAAAPHQGWGKSGGHAPLQFMHPERPLRAPGRRGLRDLGISS